MEKDIRIKMLLKNPRKLRRPRLKKPQKSQNHRNPRPWRSITRAKD
jgi:hypothetical protein